MKLFKLFFFSLLISILLGYALNIISTYFGLDDHFDQFKGMDYLDKLLLICLYAPIIETLFFQTLPFFLINKFVTNNRPTILILMSIIFALMHVSGFLDFFFGLLGGIVLANFYYETEKLKSNSILWTFILHVSYNAYGFFVLKI